MCVREVEMLDGIEGLFFGILGEEVSETSPDLDRIVFVVGEAERLCCLEHMYDELIVDLLVRGRQ
jgi:hypothetical protein